MPTEIRMTLLNSNDPTALVVQWLARNGSRVTAGQPVVRVETSKVTVDVESPAKGHIVHAVPSGARLAPGDLLAQVHASASPVPTEPDAPVASDARFSDAAASYIAEHRIPLEVFAEHALVTIHDAREAHHRRQRPTVGRDGGTAPPAAGKSVPLERDKALEIEILTGSNQLTAALSVQFDGRRVRREAQQAVSPSIGILARVVRAASRALREYPQLNAHFEGDGIVHHARLDIGFAIDLGRGLRVGVVPESCLSDVEDIEDRIAEVISRYVDDDLTLSDVTGAGVTISDLSMEDVLLFQPLLGHRQALGIGLGGDRFLPGEPLTLTAAFDHRVTNGREVSGLLRACRALLNPAGGSPESGG
ncbi:2-oxo acid dehydrogenase subunit E2 [Actinomadura monticuli]|uniref:Dihydrolipoamide acetyltransferase component of pyruvate dehydrogenase complex n=1 Tax=Actinomadura monticuli TaxID=3097367 RepID=A0ABV4Q5U0_9ACTN